MMNTQHRGFTMVTIFALAVFLVTFLPLRASASDEKPDKTGILITSFGTSMPEARPAIDNLVETAKKAFPDSEVRLAFTSNIIRRKIAREQDLIIPTPVQALAQMNDEGFTHVHVMPTHIIPGEEYDDIKGVVDAFASLKGKYGFKEVTLGVPFLNSPESCTRMAKILKEHFAAQLKQKGTAIVLMGHGTPEHMAHAMYSQLQFALDKIAYGRFFLGTVEAEPMIDDIIRNMKRNKGINKVVIAPFMIVAGDHANNDLSDKDDPESWYSLLKAAGYKNIEPNLVGLGLDTNIARWFIERIAGK